MDLVDDPAAYAADLLIDRADTGTFADVDARELSRAAGFINRTCYDAPDQARQVIEDPRFPSTVRAIIEAENNGLDAAELLAQVPRDTLAAVGEKARFGPRRTCRRIRSPGPRSGLGSLPNGRPDLAPGRRRRRPPGSVARTPQGGREDSRRARVRRTGRPDGPSPTGRAGRRRPAGNHRPRQDRRSRRALTRRHHRRRPHPRRRGDVNTAHR